MKIILVMLGSCPGATAARDTDWWCEDDEHGDAVMESVLQQLPDLEHTNRHCRQFIAALLTGSQHAAADTNRCGWDSSGVSAAAAWLRLTVVVMEWHVVCKWMACSGLWDSVGDVDGISIGVF